MTDTTLDASQVCPQCDGTGRVDPDAARPLSYADLTLDQSAHVVTRGKRELDLTPTEFRLLEAFMRRPGQVFTRRQLLAEVWGIEFASRSNTLDVHIGYLRRKTEAGGGARLIQTVHGFGYVLREQTAGGVS